MFHLKNKFLFHSYSNGAVVGIVVAVEMGIIFIVYGIRIIYIKRKKEREGKNVTWKTGRVDRKMYFYNVLFPDLEIIF